MKTLVSLSVILLAGLVGLVLVFTDLIPVPPGWVRIAVGTAFYVGAGWTLARLNARRGPLRWALGAAWGLVLLGAIGAWISITDPASGDPLLAALFLLGTPSASLLGGWLATRSGAARA